MSVMMGSASDRQFGESISISACAIRITLLVWCRLQQMNIRRGTIED